MSSLSPQNRNMVLDALMQNVAECNKFDMKMPQEHDVKELIMAGALAPFDAEVVGDDFKDFRRFYMLFGYGEVAEIMKSRIKKVTGENVVIAPWYLIVSESASITGGTLGSAVQNIRLKAVAKGLATGVVKQIGEIADDKEFCETVGIESGKKILACVAIGYKVEDLEFARRPHPEHLTSIFM